MARIDQRHVSPAKRNSSAYNCPIFVQVLKKRTLKIYQDVGIAERQKVKKQGRDDSIKR